MDGHFAMAVLGGAGAREERMRPGGFDCGGGRIGFFARSIQ